LKITAPERWARLVERLAVRTDLQDS